MLNWSYCDEEKNIIFHVVAAIPGSFKANSSMTVQYKYQNKSNYSSVK